MTSANRARGIIQNVTTRLSWTGWTVTGGRSEFPKILWMSFKNGPKGEQRDVGRGRAMAVAVGSRTHMISTATATTTTAALHPSFPVLLHGIFPIKVCVAGSDGRRISLDGGGWEWHSGTLHHKERKRGGFGSGESINCC